MLCVASSPRSFIISPPAIVLSSRDLMHSAAKPADFEEPQRNGNQVNPKN